MPFPSPGIFPTQESNPGLPHCRQMLYHLSPQGSIVTLICVPMSPLRHAVSPSKLCPLRGPDHRSLGSVIGISQVPICLAHQTSSSVLSHWLKNSLGFPGGSEGKASAYNAGDLGLIPGSGRSPGEGNGNPLQYSCLENPMEGGAW